MAIIRIWRLAVLFTKYSIVKCPVCGQAGKNLKDVEEDEKIGCRNCGSKTRASRWTDLEWPSLPHEEEEAKVRKELDKTMHYAKLLAEAINMSTEELVRMIQG